MDGRNERDVEAEVARNQEVENKVTGGRGSERKQQSAAGTGTVFGGRGAEAARNEGVESERYGREEGASGGGGTKLPATNSSESIVFLISSCYH
ncbi:hypothetical protein [Cohnella fermenti]|uniref:Uncharacterized protein n=1 Tax=Cohnella fermenti TaxID=2565925 RepID=A0A4S4BPT8_9BACL|nr:hypothetical protein [Cohnella fermenti]THF76922.1 hypothetical protein E6C55_17830 [Cohnella fermenti]